MNVLIAIGTFLLMEAIAWLTHKYLMHGWLWSLHKDHHRRDDGHFLEKNDFFFLIFAIPAFVLFLVGALGSHPIPFWIAVGITAYGAAYFLVHDIFIHQRFRLFRNTNNVYLKAIRRAHKMHHKHLNKEDGECFGMLWVPWKYFAAALKSRKA